MKILMSLPSTKNWNHVNWRYCWKCKAVKPPRSHHCSKTDRCVLRMDHYCWFTGNVVGLRNHKVFLIHAVHAWLGVTISLPWLLIQLELYTYDSIVAFNWYSPRGFTMFMCLNISLMLGATVFAQIRTIRSNRTFIEKQDLKNANPFDLQDTNLNIFSVLSKNWLSLGHSEPEIDGMNYKM